MALVILDLLDLFSGFSFCIRRSLLYILHVIGIDRCLVYSTHNLWHCISEAESEIIKGSEIIRGRGRGRDRDMQMQTQRYADAETETCRGRDRDMQSRRQTAFIAIGKD